MKENKNPQFAMGKIYILYGDDVITRPSDIYSAVRYRCDASNQGFEIIQITSRSSFRSALAKIRLETPKNSPLIHFDLHGNPRGLVLPSGAMIPWRDIAIFLTKINISSRNNLFVGFATCYSSAMLIEYIIDYPIKNDFRAFAYAMISMSGEPTSQLMEDTFPEFYSSMLENDTIDEGVRSLWRANTDEVKFIFTTCEVMLNLTIQSFLNHQKKTTFSSPIRFQTRLAEVGRLYYKKTGLFPTKKDYDVLSEYISSKSAYEDVVQDLQRKFYMIDLFPDSWKRYDLFSTIDDWELRLQQNIHTGQST